MVTRIFIACVLVLGVGGALLLRSGSNERPASAAHERSGHPPSQSARPALVHRSVTTRSSDDIDHARRALAGIAAAYSPGEARARSLALVERISHGHPMPRGKVTP